MTDRFLRLADVIELTGLPKTAIERLIKVAGFPPGVRVGAKSVRWREGEVRRWLIEQYDPAIALEEPPAAS